MSGTSMVGTIARFLGSLLLSFVLILALWWLFLAAFPSTDFIGRSPVEVYQALFTDSTAETFRSDIFHNLGITLQDTGIGFATGMIAAVVVAAVFVMFRPAAQTFMPLAMLLRSVPLVAMTPLITIIVGRGPACVAVMGGIIVFFPALVMIMTGLNNAPRQIDDVITAYGGTPATSMLMAKLPSAVPSLFAAAKVSVPGAMIGATVAEWLGTNQGLGSTLQQALPAAKYDELWASVAVITVSSILLYAAVGVIEKIVLSAMGSQAT
ncbi:ABC transporter permease [Williamsia sp. CHRR-6]|uniref:ABC transporter permease n=1 Tax=Williamsia sp. CHRR-6 TaxID=2835871 RepID=UPI001BD939C7|nr:ABC transporter permease subunit [Williamsia sp. CHRR-6]MBT0566457.1 ABC transporter permease subunit [Williamsia sp. CHRR-6]